MAEADLDGPVVPREPSTTRGRSPWIRGMACVAILPLLGFIGQSGKHLWGEVSSLLRDQGEVRTSQVIGYVDINPSPNYAKAPVNWIHDEGDATLLWASWRNGEHHWFKLGIGEIEPQRISTPMGQDVIRAIDFPLYEKAEGQRWIRVLEESPVAALTESGEAIAFPLTILDKVEVVNDLLGDRPILLAYTPISDATSIYDAVVDGKRITFGQSGYFFGNHPVLYDRGTESLWTEQDDAMVAVAGQRKGTKLKRIAKLDIVPWSDWKADHPGGRLLIGADRSKPRPLN
jgi:hypothetical protein